MKPISIKDIEFSIEIMEEDTHPKDSFFDKESLEYVIEQSEWNPWAWCMVKVTGHYMGIEESDYLGGCSYASEKDFKNDGYYEDMKQEVFKSIEEQIKKILEVHTIA